MITGELQKKYSVFLEKPEKTVVENVTEINFAMFRPFDYLQGIVLFRGNNKKYEVLYWLNVVEALRKMVYLLCNFPMCFINDAAAFEIDTEVLETSIVYHHPFEDGNADDYFSTQS